MTPIHRAILVLLVLWAIFMAAVAFAQQHEPLPPKTVVPVPAEPASPLEAPQPRTLGQKAAMHIYYYAPKTLEITYIDTYLFPDEEKCQAAIAHAGMISTPHTSHGDLIDIQCVTLHPPPRPKVPLPDSESKL